MLLTKIELLPHLEFDVDRCIDYALRIDLRLASCISPRQAD